MLREAYLSLLPRLACMTAAYYNASVKTLTVRLPEALVAEIEAESRARKLSKSDVVRERLSIRMRAPRHRRTLDSIRDLVGSVEGLPSDLSARKKEHLRKSGYGQKRPR